ncbi:hypothetical protein [Brasilonema bromeliae]|uniref:hypothetical protein n=1 Tax=Brasilonema bromeliae TaxID=383615 RepID=UPI00145EB070|nr:hypothetical protein [Brasilonema bromeliae]
MQKGFQRQMLHLGRPQDRTGSSVGVWRLTPGNPTQNVCCWVALRLTQPTITLTEPYCVIA